MDTITKLSKIFSEFPGIGPRQAKRFVYFLLSRHDGHINELIELLADLKKQIKVCGECYRFFSNNLKTHDTCDICRQNNRNHHELMIVSRDVDLENIEKSHSYMGLYFVLGGNVPILDKNPEDKIRLRELLSKIERQSAEGLNEIIFGLNANPEGEYTEEYLRKILAPLSQQHSIKLSILGRGLSTGTELEYSDSDTIKNALLNRHS
jgi:recombination protein RecR